MEGASASINDKGYGGRDVDFDKPDAAKRQIVYGRSAVVDRLVHVMPAKLAHRSVSA